MSYSEFKEFGLEVILKVLKKIDDEIRVYRDLEDYEGVKTLETEVLPKYEKLYEAFSEDAGEGIEDDNFKSVKNYILDIMNENKLSEDFIRNEIYKRKMFKGKSGSQAVENLYKHQIKELEKKKSILLKEAYSVLDQEAKLENELADSIQEEDQMKILEELPEIRRKYSILSENIMSVHEKISMILKKLEKRWPFEIYGTISKDELLKVYKEVTK